MPEPTINYAAFQRDAMRGVVRAVLQQTVKTGLPGEHHFYISFLTQAPGVILSKRLREKYPNEMTIVLQHRFWDLIVTDERFEVKLTFDTIPERLVIPFAALKVFFDPSVSYGLNFDEASAAQARPAQRQTLTADAVFDQIGEAQADAPRSAVTKKPRQARKPKGDKDQAPSVGQPAALAPSPQPTSAVAAAQSPAPDAEPIAEPPPADNGAKIFSLDHFRKK